VEKLKEKVLKKTSGGFFGIVSVLIRLTGDITAMIFTPNYNMIDDLISDLGIGPGALFFSLGLIISGIVSIPFYISLKKIFGVEEINENLRKMAIVFSSISIITYVLLGFFPSDPNNILIFVLHGVIGLISWVTGAGYLALYSYMTIKYKESSKFQGYFGYCVVGTVILFIFTWVPVTEWCMTFGIMLWIIVISISMIYDKI
jgi:hypothetical protein